MAVVTIRKRLVGTRQYFYLHHTLRTADGFQAREKYLGAKLPHNIEEVKREFLGEIYKERWYPLLDAIRANYTRELRTMPQSAIEKNARYFAVKFTYDTNRIEGSSLTYRETANLLERGLSPRSRPVGDIKEAEAHNRVLREVLEYDRDLTLQIILHWHKQLFAETKPAYAGKIRAHQVWISGSRFTPPSPAEVYPLLREFFRWYARTKGSSHPVELAAAVHLRFVTIHPFYDGNGRVSRLLMNFVLKKHGFPLLDIPYGDRMSYYNALERSQAKNTDMVFVQWFIKRYLREYARYTGGKGRSGTR
ncbi:MAG TPA: Fic family protein [Thermoplasmata archaeon]